METERTIVIIPSYNEEKNIPKVIEGIKNSISKADIAIIDDGSSDNTSLIAKSLGAEVIKLPFNMGYGVALQTGYKYALENNYDYIVQIDGDGQHDPRYIEDILRELKKEKVDLVIGSRFLANKNQVPFFRRLVIQLFASIASFLTGHKITDPCSGLRVMNKKITRFLVKDIYPEDYPDADLIIILHRAGLRIKEIPVKVYPNIQGKSMHSGLRPLYYVYKMFLSVLLTLFRRDY